MADITHNRLTIFYPTRPYLTRHGAGPLPHELPAPPCSKFEDKTNIPNPHQGTLRFAHMEVGRLVADVRKDIENLKGCEINAEAHMVWTCVDQLDGEMVHWYKRGGDKVYTPVYDLAHEVRHLVNMGRSWFTSGPTDKDVWF